MHLGWIDVCSWLLACAWDAASCDAVTRDEL